MADNDADSVEPEPADATRPLPQPEVAPEVDKSQYVVIADADALEASKRKRAATPARGPLKPDTLSTEYVVVNNDEPTPTEVIEPEPAVAAQPEPHVVYREPPIAPRARSNRGFGVLIAIAASVLFAVFFAFAVLLILRSIRGFATMSMLANYGYWIPVGLFAVALIVVALIANRAGWWAYIIGSAIVAVVVYFGSALLIAATGFYALHQNSTFAAAVGSPTAIAAGIIAREVALWSGAIISRRGRSVSARNATARTAFAEQNEPVPTNA